MNSTLSFVRCPLSRARAIRVTKQLLKSSTPFACASANTENVALHSGNMKMKNETFFHLKFDFVNIVFQVYHLIVCARALIPSEQRETECWFCSFHLSFHSIRHFILRSLVLSFVLLICHFLRAMGICCSRSGLQPFAFRVCSLFPSLFHPCSFSIRTRSKLILARVGFQSRSHNIAN